MNRVHACAQKLAAITLTSYCEWTTGQIAIADIVQNIIVVVQRVQRFNTTHAVVVI